MLIFTNNPGKASEIAAALGDLAYVMPKDIGLVLDVEEDQETLAENALKKAREGAEASGRATIADDTGLLIDALNGEPGVRVRRWPGYEAEDEEVLTFALKKMEGIPWEKRTAKFVTALAYVDPDGNELVVHGEIPGILTEERTGPYRPGLPFDSIFYIEEAGGTWAQKPEAKEIVSHRIRAVNKLKEELTKRGIKLRA